MSSTLSTIRMSANNLSVDKNLTTDTIQSHFVSPKTAGGTLGILTSGTNETVNIGNSTSNVKINGNVVLGQHIGNFNMSGFFNQLS